MKLLASLVTLVVLITASPQGSSADTPEAAAESAALTWLGLVDAGDYAQSWVTGAEYFRSSILQSQWVTSVSHVRDSLGGLKSRRLSGASARPFNFTVRFPGEAHECGMRLL